jgi:hypothetical protein
LFQLCFIFFFFLSNLKFSCVGFFLISQGHFRTIFGFFEFIYKKKNLQNLRNFFIFHVPKDHLCLSILVDHSHFLI